MTHQLPIPFSHRGSIDEQFERFHAANPNVYAMFTTLAKQAMDAGRKRWSADGIFHVMRWELQVRTRSDDNFRLNDHFTALYARKLVEADARFKGFFVLKERKTA